MIKYEFDFLKSPTESEEFAEASVHELKVLITLIECGGVCSDDDLVEKSGVSKSRIAASLALWQEAGVIAPREHNKEVSFYGNSVFEEFPERIILGELEEESALSVARTIRNKGLADLFNEIAALMGKPMLTPQEVKRLSELSSQYQLSEEYILALAAHLLSKGSLTVNYIVKRAENLVGKGITNLDELTEYLNDVERESNDLMEYKRELGIYGRKLSPTEIALFKKWRYDFGYGIEIVKQAYDFNVVNTSKMNVSYMDKLLCDWHEHSCKTVDECLNRYKERKISLELEAEKKREEMNARRPQKKTAAPKPRYGDFDPEEAFKIALSRSFGNNKDEKTEAT